VRNSELTEQIIGAAIEVHKVLGPGLLESAYKECLCYELEKSGIDFEKEKILPVNYKGLKLDCVYRFDLFVDKKVIVELKAVEKILPVHEAQLLTYLRLAAVNTGLLLNFNTPLLKDGIKRFVL